MFEGGIGDVVDLSFVIFPGRPSQADMIRSYEGLVPANALPAGAVATAKLFLTQVRKEKRRASFTSLSTL